MIAARLAYLRATALTLVQIALAVGIAWFVASEVVDHTRPFFAPIAAVLTLGLTAGRRGVRAVEIGIGVTLGITVGDLIVNVIGGGTWQLVVTVPAAMAVAILLGAGPAVVSQTGVSAVLVVVLEQPEGFLFERSVDAAIGSAAALLMTYVLLPPNPLRLVRREAAPLLRELAGTLEDVAAALEARDHEVAARALARAREADRHADAFSDALAAGRETAFAALPRRRALGEIELYVEAGAQLDLAVRNTRVLARFARRAIEVDDHVPPAVPEGLRDLARAVRALEPWLEDPARHDDIREPAVAAAKRATAVLEETGNLSVSVMVGAIRSAAVDLLRGTGLDRDEALELVRRGAPLG